MKPIIDPDILGGIGTAAMIGGAICTVAKELITREQQNLRIEKAAIKAVEAALKARGL